MSTLTTLATSVRPGVLYAPRRTSTRVGRLKIADLMIQAGMVRRTAQNALASLTEAGLLHLIGAAQPHGTR
jgi:hypothetical protein